MWIVLLFIVLTLEKPLTNWINAKADELRARAERIRGRKENNHD